MSDRTVKVRLVAAVADYERGLTRASNATKRFGTDAAKSTKAVSQELNDVNGKATIAGAALLAMAGTSVVAMARFEKSMSNVKAVTGASAAEMDRLRTSALKAGQATVFSASQAADAQAELAKAGVSTADILGGALTGSLDLAAAGGLDLANAATIAAQAMNVFGLAGQDVSHIADVLASGANKSAADIGSLGDALRQGGLVAKQTGLGLEDTVGVLSAFADNALVGSDAGTSLKTMLQRLTPQSQEAADKMAELGINAYDAQGQFVGITKFAGILQKSLKDLTPEARASAMAIIFGSDAVRAANVLYELGSSGVRDYTDAMNDNGAASRMAGTQLDNLAGDWEQLTGAIETGFIQSGSGANDVLRDMTQAATETVNFIGDLPGPILAAGVAATAAGGAFLIAAPKIAEFNAALASSPRLAKAAAGAMKALGPAIAVTAIATLALDIRSSNEELDRLNDHLRELYGTLGKDIDASSIQEVKQQAQDLERTFNDPGWIRYFKSGLEIIAGGKGEIAETADMAAEARAQFGKWQQAVGEVAFALGVDSTRAMQLLDESGTGLNGTMTEIVGNVRAYVDSTQRGGAATQRAAGAMDTLADSTISAEDQIKALKDAWDATIGVMLGTSNAQIAAEDALDSLTKSLKDNGNNWNINTEKGRENLSAWNDVVDSAEKVREAKLDEGASVKAADAAYVGYLERAKKAPGLTDAQRASVQKLIDKYKALPTKKTTTVTANTEPARTALAQLATYYANLFQSSYAPGGSTYQSQVPKAARRASGGEVVGPGTGTSDSVPIMASNGEYVVKESSVRKYGTPMLNAINQGKFRNGGLVGYANGGRVRPGRRYRFGESSQIRDASIDSAALDFDFTAYGQAVDRARDAVQGLAQAQDALAQARERVNMAGTPQEQAQASRDLAAAEHDLAAAKKETAAAERAKNAARPTGANILSQFRDRARKLERFKSDLYKLSKLGLSSTILKQLLDAGIDEGGAMAAALVSDPGMIASLNKTQAEINADSAWLGRMFGTKDASSSGSASTSAATSGTSGATATQVLIGFENAKKPMVLKVDSHEVWRGLLELKESKGGMKLGLA